MRLAAAVLLLLPAAAALAADSGCVPAGRWGRPAAGAVQPADADRVLAQAARRRVVLLGEQHPSRDDHRWQLHTLAGLHALHPRLAVGLEMFPRRVQPVLDAWVEGRITEAQLLARSHWDEVWGGDPSLYLPLLHFARLHRVPLIALNVERSLTRRVRAHGLDAVPAAEREGVGRPVPAPQPYRDLLWETFRTHPAPPGGDAEGTPQRSGAAFAHFVEAMLVWDRAMAEAIAARAAADPGLLVVALVGRGHVEHGYGVARQLADLQLSGVAALLPWPSARGCDAMRADLADAVFGIPPAAAAAPPAQPRPRLGIRLAADAQGVRIDGVFPDSVAEAAGLREGDVIESMAGTPVEDIGAVVAAVRRQPPGTWLPMGVRRDGERIDLVARFPPDPPR